jgi:nucleoporin NDC1
MSGTTLNQSGLWSRTSTPTRAITSTLAARTAPPIPSASQSYEPLVKSVLRNRLTYRTFFYSAVLSWVLTVVWSSWSQPLAVVEILLLPIQPATILFAVANWAIGALPILVLRKVFLLGEWNIDYEWFRVGGALPTMNMSFSRWTCQEY